MEKEQKITLLRAAIMTPYLNDDRIFNFYTKKNRQSNGKETKRNHPIELIFV